jgi:hypothetical protein
MATNSNKPGLLDLKEEGLSSKGILTIIISARGRELESITKGR